jgi:hypothetical protein
MFCATRLIVTLCPAGVVARGVVIAVVVVAGVLVVAEVEVGEDCLAEQAPAANTAVTITSISPARTTNRLVIYLPPSRRIGTVKIIEIDNGIVIELVRKMLRN